MNDKHRYNNKTNTIKQSMTLKKSFKVRIVNTACPHRHHTDYVETMEVPEDIQIYHPFIALISSCNY